VGPIDGCWYRVCDLEVNGCGKTDTELENCDDQIGIFLLEVGFGR
jgi:hypothetical protein